MSTIIQGSLRARVAAKNALIKGDDNAYYQLSLVDDGAGGFVLSLGPYSGSLDNTRNFSDKSVGTAFFLTDPLGGIHRFNMVSDGPQTTTYGLQDAATTTSLPVAVDFVVQTARFDAGIPMVDTDGAGSHTLTVTGGTLTQDN